MVEEIGADQARENRIRSGLIVVSVDSNSPAEIAGLKVNDIIVQIGYQRIEDIRQYDALVRQLRGQKPIALRFYRGGNAYFTTLEIN